MAFTLLLSFTACSNTSNREGVSTAPQSDGPSAGPAESSDAPSASAESPVPESEPAETGSDALVVYFSWSGNTETVAKSIQSQTGADLFELVPVTPYSEDYDTVVELAREEQREDARPAISGSIDHIGDYDVICVGFPNWWGDMPMLLYTFFDSYDFSGKTIAPFCTSGGSGLSDTVDTIRELEPNATVTDGLHIGSSSAAEPDRAVESWLSEIGFAN